MNITIRCKKCNRTLTADFGPYNEGWNLFVRTVLNREQVIAAIEGLIAYFSFEEEGTERWCNCEVKSTTST